MKRSHGSYIKPAPPVTSMFLILGSGSCLVVPSRRGAESRDSALCALPVPFCMISTVGSTVAIALNRVIRRLDCGSAIAGG